jgi:hypothetical protein
MYAEQSTYKPVAEALATLREISKFEQAQVIGTAYRLREVLQAQLDQMHPRLEADYIRFALMIWDGTA